MFVVFPNPSGGSGTSESLGWWSVIITNLANQTMYVNRIVIQAISQPTAAAKVFQSTSKLVPYEPTGTGGIQGSWTVPEDNVLVWSTTEGQGWTIPPVGAQQFAAKIESGTITSSALYTIAAAAYTSFGKFSNIGHTSAAIKPAEGTTIVNIFPVNVTSISGTPISGLSDDDAVDNRINSVITVTQSGTTPASGTAYFVLREGQDGGTSSDYIPAGSTTMIINFPAGFTFGTITGQSNFGTPTIVGFADGSQQIRVSTSADLGRDGTTGGPNDTDAGRFLFQVPFTAPLVEDDRLYVIYSFVSGFDSNGNHLGPVSEAFLIKVNVP